jgi:cyclopropane-fatty-acyl-phospholipid synthase
MLQEQAERDAAERTRTAQIEHERREVAKHYEHDPEIFELVLDRRLAYSTALFADPAEDLDTAQARKLDYVAQRLALSEGDEVLDVGCGWGSVLLYIAENTPARVRGITLSAAQRTVALTRAERAGVAGRVRIDLRHVGDGLDVAPGSMAAIVFSGSIVHMHDRESVHDQVATLLRPGGRMLISDCYFPYVARGDRRSAATHYIFHEALGYCRLLSLHEELAMIERQGLDILGVENVTDSYVLTLSRWIENVRRHRGEIERRAPGFSRVLQQYMTIARLSFVRGTALEYMIWAQKPVEGLPYHR